MGGELPWSGDVPDLFPISGKKKKLVESNSGSSEYFPGPRNEKQAELDQAESLNIC